MIKYFQNTVTEFTIIQNDIKKMKQNSIIRNAEIMLNRRIENQEKDEFLNNPNALHDQIKAKLSDTAPMKLQNAYNDIKERSNDLTRLEKVIIINIEYERSYSAIYGSFCFSQITRRNNR